MEQGQLVLIEVLGLKITLWMLITGLVGGIPALAGLYKMYVLWDTREERRYKMLRRYLENEERNISSKRSKILKSIRDASRSYLTDREFDVGREIDQAIVHLDSGHPELAEARLKEIEKRLQSNENLLRRRADDLEKHRASVHIFIAALASELNNSDVGLNHVQEALAYDPNDLDALKCQAQLLLSKRDFGLARQCFERLKRASSGNENASYRADAYVGLAMVEIATGVSGYDKAWQNLATAANNLKNVPPLDLDPYLRAQIHRVRGDMLADEAWDECDAPSAHQEYSEAVNVLKEIKLKRVELEIEIEALKAKMKKLELHTSPSAGQMLLLSD